MTARTSFSRGLRASRRWPWSRNGSLCRCGGSIEALPNDFRRSVAAWNCGPPPPPGPPPAGLETAGLGFEGEERAVEKPQKWRGCPSDYGIEGSVVHEKPSAFPTKHTPRSSSWRSMLREEGAGARSGVQHARLRPNQDIVGGRIEEARDRQTKSVDTSQDKSEAPALSTELLHPGPSEGEGFRGGPLPDKAQQQQQRKPSEKVHLPNIRERGEAKYRGRTPWHPEKNTGVAQRLASLGRSSHWAEAVDVLAGAKLLESEMLVAYTAAINACSRGQQWAQALQLLLDMSKCQGLAVDVVACSATIGACQKSAQWQRAIQLLGSMRSAFGIAPNVVSYNCAIGACSAGKQWPFALMLLAECEAAGLVPSVVTHTAAIAGCDRAGQWQWALWLLQELLQRAAAGRRGLLEGGEGPAAGKSPVAWQRQARPPGGGTEKDKQRTLQPDLAVFGTGLRACQRSHSWREALWLRDEMRHWSVEADDAAWMAAVRACIGAQQWPQALSLLEELRSESRASGVGALEVAALEEVATACATGLRWDLALALLGAGPGPGFSAFSAENNSNNNSNNSSSNNSNNSTKQREGGLPLPRKAAAFGLGTRACVAVACAEAQQWQQALALLAGASTNNNSSNSNNNSNINSNNSNNNNNNNTSQYGSAQQDACRLFNATMSACSRSQQWERALGIFAGMRSGDGPKPDAVSFTSAITACEAGSAWAGALSILDSLLDKRSAVQPGVVTFTAVISALEKAQQWQRALATFTQMKVAGGPQKPSLISCSAAISACAKGQQWQQALSILAFSQQSSLRPNVISFTSAISACARQWEQALGLLVGMGAAGVKPTAIAYNALINACSKGRQWQCAVSLLRDMSSRELLEPDIVSFNATISAMGTSSVETAWVKPTSVGALGLPLVASAPPPPPFRPRAQVAGSRESPPPPPLKHPPADAPLLFWSSAASASAAAPLASLALDSHRHWQRWQRALELLAEVHLRGLQPTVITFNAAVNACTSAGEWQQALELLGSLRRAGLEPSQATFHTLLAACDVAGLWELALQLLTQLQQCTLPVGSSPKKEPLEARLPQAGHYQWADPQLAYGAAISACSRAQQRGVAMALLQELRTGAPARESARRPDADEQKNRKEKWGNWGLEMWKLGGE
ncbi:unnamed protein product, partial [Polarella glacialis]